MRRKGEKIALGFFACLPILCLLTAVVLYVTGWGNRLWNTVVLAGRGQSMVNLSRRTPFVPPQGAEVSEERLEAYMKELGAAMEAQGMGPDEFCWIHERMRTAAGVSSSAAGGDPAGQNAPPRPEDLADAALYARFAERIEACALREHSLRIACGFASRRPERR